MFSSLFGRGWAERVDSMVTCSTVRNSSQRGGSAGQALHRALGVSAWVPVLQWGPRTLAAGSQPRLLGSRAVTAVLSGAASWCSAHLAGAGSCTPPHPSRLALGISPALYQSFQRLGGTNAITTVELTHRRNRNVKECQWGGALLWK